jgi:hypothetical protein
VGHTIHRAIFLFLVVGVCLDSKPLVSIAAGYQWHEISPGGKGCFPPKCVDGQYPMAVLPLTAFNGDLFLIGDSRIWVSSNGIDWRSRPKTDWNERYGMQFAYFQNKLWMLGGMRTWDDFRNDVWSSVDGKDWKQVAVKGPWLPRRGHAVAVFRNRLWILGGALTSGRRDQTPTRFLNDVWSSDDGVTWREETRAAPWLARDNHITVVFDNKIWVIGGGRGGEHSDVWSSDDGKNWTLVIENTGWGTRHGNGGAVFDGKIWVYGGVERNDVWSSIDGKTWNKVFANAPWSTRSARYSVAFKDKLWIFSGKTGRADTQVGDIWVMIKSD